MVDMGGSGGGGVSPTAQQYCLKWNNHQSNLLRVFMRLLGQEQFTDVTIASEGRRIKCHKMVLSACSSYFEQLFMVYSEPNQIVILKDTPYQDIAAIVEFMYKGEINVSQDRLSSLLKTAENLKVKGLAEVSGEEKKNPKTTPSSVQQSTNNNYSNGLGAVNDLMSNGLTSRGALTAPRLQGPPPMQMMGRPPIVAASELMNGDNKRKRGRPRTLDGPEDEPTFNPRISSVQGGISSMNPLLISGSGASSREGSVSPFKHRIMGPSPVTLGMSPLQAALNRPLSELSDRPSVSPPVSTPSSPLSTPIKTERLTEMDMLKMTPPNQQEFLNPLTPEKIAAWGIVKMNDYLVTGTRQQYWEEIFVKNVMESVKNKEIDMKGAAELLGVSYGTLYGRYRENFGYLKHAWNLSGRPQKKNNLWNDPNTKAVLESMRAGNINIKQAAEALGMEPAMLAYQLAGKVPGGEGGLDGSEEGEEEEEEEEDDDEMDMHEMMEIQPEIIVGETTDVKKQEPHDEAFDSIVEEVD